METMKTGKIVSRFITFEGVDGCGKSTQIQMLTNYLALKGYEFVVVREPGGTEVGEAIRSILLSEEFDPCAESELLLYLASRAQLTRKVVIPALEDGKLVIADRYADSSTVYQGYARGIGMEKVKELNAFATFGLVPHITFILDIPSKVALERMKKKSRDRLEKEGEDFLERVREGYMRLATEEPDRFIVVDARKTPEEVFREIRSHLKERGVIR